MPRKRYHELIVGFFILVTTGLFFLLLILMGAFETMLRPSRDVKVVFEEVQGLRSGDPVFFLGRKIGTVRSLEFVDAWVPPDTRQYKVSRVLATLAIPGEDWNRLKTDSIVVVDKSITGNLSVLIGEGRSNDFLSELGEKEREDVLLQGDVVFDIDETGEQLTMALDKVNTLLTEITDLITKVHESGHVQGILKDIADTTEKLRERSGPVVDTVRDIASEVQGILKENRENLRSAVSDASEAAAHLKQFFDRRLDPAAQSLEDALSDARKAAASLHDLIGRNRGRVDDIVGSIQVASGNAETLTAEIRRRPWRLLYEPSAEEIETLGLYDAAWAYNLSARALQRSVQDLSSLAQLSEKVEPEVVQKALKEVEANLDRQRETEDAFYAMLRVRVGK